MSEPRDTKAGAGETYITCEEVIAFLLEYLSRELTPDKEHEFERHLGVCPSCVHYLKTYQAAVKLGKEVLGREDAVPAELAPALVEAILKSRPR